MLGKLKENASAKALAVIEPLVATQLEKLAQLPPATVRDDASFRSKFVSPSILAVAAASGGATALVPGFNQRIEGLLFRLRDELVVEKEGRLALVDDYRARLPELVRAMLKGN